MTPHMQTENTIRQVIMQSIALKENIASDEALLHKIAEVGSLIAGRVSAGGRVMFAGNGGSAADSQHLAAEFVSRFEFDRPGLPAVALCTDTSVLTSIGNDYGFDMLFSRQLQAQATRADIFVGITTSGLSVNILKAFEECKRLDVMTIALCGQGGNLEDFANYVIRVPSTNTARIQECHILIGHILCAIVESSVYGHMRPSEAR
jgi:D-sedoheptulose 7-phosphate isomerase